MVKSNYKIEEIDLQAASDSILDQYLDVLRAIKQEITPFDSLPSRKFFERTIQNPNKYLQTHRWVITSDQKPNKIIGNAKIEFETEFSPSYQSNIHLVYGDINLFKEHRRKGIGSECLKKMVNKAKKNNKSVLQGVATLAAGHQFCKKLNGLTVLKTDTNRLYYKNIDWDLIKNWRENGPKWARGVTIERFKNVPEKDLQEYSDLLTEVFSQIPMGKIEIKSKITPAILRLKEAQIEKKGVEPITMISREEDGTISGLTERYFNPENPSDLHVRLTGVRKKYQGRSLGKWLKAEMLYYIKAKYPSISYETTYNATSNAPMQAINYKMGYRKLTENVIFKFNMADLERQRCFA